MMVIIRNFKGAFENALSGGGCSSKATAESVGLTMSSDRSMLNILVNFLLLFLAVWDIVVNATLEMCGNSYCSCQRLHQ